MVVSKQKLNSRETNKVEKVIKKFAKRKLGELGLLLSTLHHKYYTNKHTLMKSQFYPLTYRNQKSKHPKRQWQNCQDNGNI